MKKQCKKILTLFSFLTFLFISCQKNISDRLYIKSEFLDAKVWVDNNQIQILENENLKNSIINNLEKSHLEWENAISSKVKPGEIEVPIVAAKSKSYIPISQYGADTSVRNNLLALILKPNNEGGYDYSFKLNIGNYHFFKTKKKKQRHFEYEPDYSGIVLFLDKNGVLLYGEKYLGGKKAGKITTLRKKNNQPILSQIKSSNSSNTSNIANVALPPAEDGVLAP